MSICAPELKMSALQSRNIAVCHGKIIKNGYIECWFAPFVNFANWVHSFEDVQATAVVAVWKLWSNGPSLMCEMDAVAGRLPWQDSSIMFNNSSKETTLLQFHMYAPFCFYKSLKQVITSREDYAVEDKITTRDDLWASLQNQNSSICGSVIKHSGHRETCWTANLMRPDRLST